MRRYTRAMLAPLCGLLLTPTSAIAALYSGWDSVAPITDVRDDASAGIDIDSIRFAMDATGTKFFRMDVNGATPVVGSTYSFYAANSPGLLTDPDSADYIFMDKFKPGVISFTKTFTNNTDSDATSHFNYERASDSKFFLEWSLHNDTTLNEVFYIAGSTYSNTGLGGSDRTNVSPTPIPAAGWMLGSGILCLIGLKRRSQ